MVSNTKTWKIPGDLIVNPRSLSRRKIAILVSEEMD